MLFESLCQRAMTSLLWAILALTHHCFLKIPVTSFSVRCSCTLPCWWDQLFSQTTFLAVGRIRDWSSEHTPRSNSHSPSMPLLDTQKNGCVTLFFLQINYLLLPFWWISQFSFSEISSNQMINVSKTLQTSISVGLERAFILNSWISYWYYVAVHCPALPVL